MNDATGLQPTIGKVIEVDVDQLTRDSGQPRRDFDKKALDKLAESIKARGILQPIQARIFGGLTMIVDGERRWRAAKLAKLKTVPVMLVNQTENLEQLRIDQVAVNQLREDLSPLEFGFVLRRLRDDEKRTPNEIAAHLAKNGMGSLKVAEVDGLIALTYLPAWAHEMVAKEEVELKHLTPLVKHAKSKEIMEIAHESLQEQVDWGGKVTEREVEHAIENGLDETYQALAGSALFDWKKICQGCPNLIRSGSAGFCTDEKRFEEKQAEARKQAEDLGRKAKVGGGVDKPREPTAAEKGERTEQRAQSLRGKAEEYLHAYLMRAIAPQIDEVADQLMLFAALKRPNLYDSEWHHRGAPGCHYPDGQAEPVEKLGSLKAAQDHKINALEAVLKKRTAKQRAEIVHSIALETLFELPWREIQVLAHHVLGDDISKIWTLEEPFLQLFRKGELAHLAKTHKVPMPEGVTDWAAMKGGDLRAAILEHPKLLRAPQILVDLYRKVEKPDRHSFD